MKRDVHIDTFLTLSQSGINETKKEASKEAIDELGEEEGRDELYYSDCVWEADELYFDEEEQGLMISGDIVYRGKRLGYLSPTIKISDLIVVEMIKYYIEKLDKLKAILKD